MRDYGTSRGVQQFVLDTHSVSHGARQSRGHFLSQAKVGGLSVSTNHMADGVMPNLCRGLTFESERHPHVRAKFACDFPAVIRGIIPCLGMDVPWILLDTAIPFTIVLRQGLLSLV